MAAEEAIPVDLSRQAATATMKTPTLTVGRPGDTYGRAAVDGPRLTLEMRAGLLAASLGETLRQCSSCQAHV
jgi:hypothetical protein